MGSAVIPSACRIEPAIGSDLASRPPYTLNDQDFLKLVAILRLAVPYTGIIMSTRENRLSGSGRWNSAFPRFRRAAVPIRWLSGIQPVRGGTISAWRSPPLAEVIADLRTAQIHSLFLHRLLSSRPYRQRFHGSGETGPHQEKCAPNALSTFEEYLLDYGTPEAREAGERSIAAALDGMDGRIRKVSENLLAKVRDGRRDVCC